MKFNSFIFQFFCITFLLAIDSTISQKVIGSVSTVFTDDKKGSSNVSPVLSKKLRNNIINELKRKEPVVSPSRASGPGFLVSTGINVGLQSSPNAQLIDKASSVALNLSQVVSKNLDENSQSSVLSNVKAPAHFCPFKQSFDCDSNALFRTMDGSCNNLQTPWWGKAETPYKRYVKPSYKDGITEPRTLAKSGNPLPNPRVISNTLFSDNKKTEDFYTLILPLFGQFLAHDIVSTAVTTDSAGQIINCPCHSVNASCLSFDIPEDEKIMKFSDCMSFTRSSAAFPTFDCTLGTREQLNLLSSFIDGSQVYGLNENRSLDLRLFHGGQLLFSESVSHKHMLPTATDRQCKDTTEKIKCFGAGEGRTNENLGLLSLQTLFLREHNRIAKILTKLQPTWDDERTYQETRKILTSVMQHITYNEFLPTVIGWKAAALFDLTPLSTNNYYSGYNIKADPTIANEFATAAFRFGHTLIKNQFLRANNKNQRTGSVNLSEIIFRPVEAYNEKAGGLESILYGTINDAAAKFDTSFSDTLQNHLFEIKDSSGAFAAVDLASTNINRGRDHGIPPYNSYRRKCGLSVAKSFDDLKDSMSPEAIRGLSQIYEDVDDIDLYVGGLSEKPLQGAVVGPTFSCIIGNQFIDLKRGDRFYYENGPAVASFTLDQLREIKKVTLASVLCDNTDLVDVQPNVFLQPLPNLNNTRVSCNTIPRINFNIWND